MTSFEITGGNPLYGCIRLGGAKNASFKLMIASLLSTGESRLLNFSNISEVDMTAKIINAIGGKTERRGERAMFIDPRNINKHEIPQEFGPKSRSAPMFMPILLHKLGKAKVPHPGGDRIGVRPLDRHWDGLEKMGVKIHLDDSYIYAETSGLVGTSYTFNKNTHTGTETLIMAAVLAKGKTVLKNAALEPEVDDLIIMLNNMGARIRRRFHKVIEIDGVDFLEPTIHKIMPDRNEAISYACAAIATKGDIIVENARRQDLEAFLEKLDEVGGGYEIGKFGIRFFYHSPLKAADIITQPHPGFMTDWQPLWASLLTQAHGDSTIVEAIYPMRFHYLKHMKQMGVKIKKFNPEFENPDKVYNFDSSNDDPNNFHAITISGPASLKPGTYKVEDLRHGATLIILSLICPGKSTIQNIEQVDRGYEDLDERLRSMGANIKRINQT